MKMKAIVTAVSLAVAGVAQADINSDNMPGFGDNVFGPVGGVGELFISVVARNAANPTLNNSYAFDTGITADTFVDAWLGGTLGSLNGLTVDLTRGGTDSNFASFLADNSAPGFTISYNMLAVHNDENYSPLTYAAANAGFLTSSANTLGAVAGPQGGQTGFNQSAININNYLTQVNVAMPGTSVADNSSIRAGSTSTAFHDSPNWGSNNVFGFNTEGSLNSALNFYFLGFSDQDQNVSIAPVSFGTWNLNGSTQELSFSTVPVPAAVWLFGAGLMGLVGVARRRSA